jgi:hypothetical protein
MSISSTRLVQEVDLLLADAGHGWIPGHLPGGGCTEPFQVRVPLSNVNHFSFWIFDLKHRLGLPAPEYLEFLYGKALKHKCTFFEAAYLFDRENLIILRDLLVAAFESGEQPGFMALEQ